MLLINRLNDRDIWMKKPEHFVLLICCVLKNTQQ
jgi:hypothetical protein